jgi:hypothetical protein
MDSFRQTFFFVCFYAVLAAILLMPLASNQVIPNLADIFNHLAAIMQAKLAISEGQFPLRIAPLDQAGWRYPLFQFYGSFSYFFSALIYKYLTPNNPFLAYKITLGCALVLGGIYFNRLAYWLVGSRAAAMLSSIVYLATPYYIIVINHLGAFNEGIALGLIPVVLFYTLQRFYFPSQDKIFIQTALAWFLLASVHLVTFFYTSLFVAMFIILLAVRTSKPLKKLIAVGLAYVFSCMLAMWYLAPVVLYKTLFIIGNQTNTFYPQSLLSLLWLTANITDERLAIVGIHPAIGWPILFAAFVSFYAYVKQQRSHESVPNWVLPLLVLFCISFILVWSPINFWHWLPNLLRVGQYSWRLLSQLTWIGALLFAWAINWLFNNKLDKTHIFLGAILILCSTSAWLIVSEVNYVAFDDLKKIPVSVSNANDYLIYAQQHLNLVNNIDNISLDTLLTLIDNGMSVLKLNQPINLPKPLIASAAQPFINIQGSIPADAKVDNLQLATVVNNQVINLYRLKAGRFDLNIPLSQLANQGQLNLHFEVQNSEQKNLKTINVLPVDDLTLNGFMAPSSVIPVLKVKPACEQIKALTICRLKVPLTTKLIELPIFYYPDMLAVTVNGRRVDYQSVLYKDYLIAAVVPVAGTENIISAEFVGLEWANFVSAMSWGLLILFSMFMLLSSEPSYLTPQKNK